MNKHYNKLINKLFKYYHDDNTNLVFSPLSIWTILEILKDSTDGKTKEELINQILKDEEINISENDNLHMANALFCKEEYKEGIRKEYIDFIDNKYSAKLFSSKNIVNDINKWVKRKTHGMINEIINEKADIDLGILNAISFIAKWKDPYPLYDIKKKIFHNSNGKNRKVDLMFSNENNYVENKKVIGFTKDYNNNQFSFMALLPKNEKDNLNDIVSSLDFQELYNSKKYHHSVYTNMPKFKVETTLSLPEFLIKNKIKTIFEDYGDFTPISDIPLKVENIKHKSYIEVDNEGTKAAAITVVNFFATGIPNPNDIIEITLDRPFIYAIMHNETKLPIFVGCINNL